MIKKKTFERILSLLQSKTSFKKIADRTGSKIPVICAISKGWKPLFPNGRPSRNWNQALPTVKCDQNCDRCPQARAEKKVQEVICAVPPDECFLGIYLNPECAKRYDELHYKKVQEEQNEDWMTRCFPK